MSNYEFDYEMPVAGGETPTYVPPTHVLPLDAFDEPFGEVPGTNLENLIRKD